MGNGPWSIKTRSSMYEGCDSSVSAAEACRANAERLRLSRTICATVALMESTDSGLRVDVRSAPSLGFCIDPCGFPPETPDTRLDQLIVVAITQRGKHNPIGDALELC